MWKQRSRVQWLKKGDKNTKNFHARATSRRKQNRLLKLRTGNGRWVDDTDGLCNMVSSYFENTFHISTSSTQPECVEVVSCLEKSLCDSDEAKN